MNPQATRSPGFACPATVLAVMVLSLGVTAMMPAPAHGQQAGGQGEAIDFQNQDVECASAKAFLASRGFNRHTLANLSCGLAKMYARNRGWESASDRRARLEAERQREQRRREHEQRMREQQRQHEQWMRERHRQHEQGVREHEQRMGEIQRQAEQTRSDVAQRWRDFSQSLAERSQIEHERRMREHEQRMRELSADLSTPSPHRAGYLDGTRDAWDYTGRVLDGAERVTNTTTPFRSGVQDYVGTAVDGSAPVEDSLRTLARPVRGLEAPVSGQITRADRVGAAPSPYRGPSIVDLAPRGPAPPDRQQIRLRELRLGIEQIMPARPIKLSPWTGAHTDVDTRTPWSVYREFDELQDGSAPRSVLVGSSSSDDGRSWRADEFDEFDRPHAAHPVERPTRRMDWSEFDD